MTTEELFEKIVGLIKPLEINLGKIDLKLNRIETRLNNLEAVQNTHTTRLRGIKMVLTRVRKDVHYITGNFDTRITENRRRIETIESHVSIQPH
ncbi:MAG TPA: hypothetical protein VLG12_03985 [Candidatus Saccharimonadales bacterium]|nr:hypothetical protein [Candidatus Saccharimonadales bacterium]